MRVHKQDDEDQEGKRIASEADRRYILTHGVTGRSSGSGVGKKGSAAATSSTEEAKGANGGAPTASKYFCAVLLSRAVGMRTTRKLTCSFRHISV